MSAPHRVLHVCEPTHAGAAQVTFNLATGLAPHGFQAIVCTPPGDLADWCAATGIPVLTLPFTRRDPAAYARAAAVVGRAMRQAGVSLVHAHSSFSGALVRGLRPAAGPPIVFQPHAWSFQALHGAPRGVAVSVERALARRTDLLVCVSEEERAIGEAADVRPRATLVVDNAVAFDGPERTGTTPPSAPVIGAVARFTPQKGIDVLLQALADPRWPAHARLEIAGGGPQWAQLTELAAALGVGDRVRFLGRLPDVAPRLRGWDLFVSPARYEGASIALLEAIAAGLPVVCTDVAGARTLTDPRRPPVPVEDPSALAAAVAEAVGDWTLTQEVASVVRDRARERHSLEAQSALMAAGYRTLLDDKS